MCGMENIESNLLKPFKEEGFWVSKSNLPFTASVVMSEKYCSNHWHNYIEFLYIIRGCFLANIGNKEFSLEKGSFLIINSGEVHGIQPVVENNGLILVQFEPWVVNTGTESVFESKYIIPFLHYQVRYLPHIKLECDNELELILMQIIEDFNSELPGFELNIKANIYRVFSWLIKNKYIVIPYQEEGFNYLAVRRLNEVLVYVENNYRNEITVNDAAKIACMSYYHFCRCFKKAIGKTFIDYLNCVRLSRAEKLILTTGQSIINIAQEVGIENASYFDQLFKEKNGLSPREYKNFILKESNITKEESKSVI